MARDYNKPNPFDEIDLDVRFDATGKAYRKVRPLTPPEEAADMSNLEKAWAHLVSGGKGLVRNLAISEIENAMGTIGGAKDGLLADYDTEGLSETAKAYMQKGLDVASQKAEEAYQGVRKNPHLQGKEVHHDTYLGKVAGGAVENLPQLGAVILSGMAGAPSAGLALIGAMTQGAAYDDLRERGVDEETARVGAALSAAGQTALEGVGLKASGLIPRPEAVSRGVLRGMGRGIAGESATEMAQQVVDRGFTNFLDPKQNAAQAFHNTLTTPEAIEDITLAGAIGGLYGGLGGAAMGKADTLYQNRQAKWGLDVANAATRAGKANGVYRAKSGEYYDIRAERAKLDKVRGSVVDNAESRNGMPYGLGADGTQATDCGLHVKAAWASVGLGLSHRTADGQYRDLEEAGAIFGDKDKLKPGDVVFWHVPENESRWATSDDPDAVNTDDKAYKGITHVGIYVGKGMVSQAGNAGVANINLDTYPVVGFGSMHDYVAGTQEGAEQAKQRAERAAQKEGAREQQQAVYALAEDMLHSKLAESYVLDAKEKSSDPRVINDITNAMANGENPIATAERHGWVRPKPTESRTDNKQTENPTLPKQEQTESPQSEPIRPPKQERYTAKGKQEYVREQVARVQQTVQQAEAARAAQQAASVLGETGLSPEQMQAEQQDRLAQEQDLTNRMAAAMNGTPQEVHGAQAVVGDTTPYLRRTDVAQAVAPNVPPIMQAEPNVPAEPQVEQQTLNEPVLAQQVATNEELQQAEQQQAEQQRAEQRQAEQQRAEQQRAELQLARQRLEQAIAMRAQQLEQAQQAETNQAQEAPAPLAEQTQAVVGKMAEALASEPDPTTPPAAVPETPARATQDTPKIEQPKDLFKDVWAEDAPARIAKIPEVAAMVAKMPSVKTDGRQAKVKIVAGKKAEPLFKEIVGSPRHYTSSQVMGRGTFVVVHALSTGDFGILLGISEKLASQTGEGWVGAGYVVTSPNPYRSLAAIHEKAAQWANSLVKDARKTLDGVASSVADIFARALSECANDCYVKMEKDKAAGRKAQAAEITQTGRKKKAKLSKSLERVMRDAESEKNPLAKAPRRGKRSRAKWKKEKPVDQVAVLAADMFEDPRHVVAERQVGDGRSVGIVALPGSGSAVLFFQEPRETTEFKQLYWPNFKGMFGSDDRLESYLVPHYIVGYVRYLGVFDKNHTGRIHREPTVKAYTDATIECLYEVGDKLNQYAISKKAEESEPNPLADTDEKEHNNSKESLEKSPVEQANRDKTKHGEVHDDAQGSAQALERANRPDEKQAERTVADRVQAEDGRSGRRDVSEQPENTGATERDGSEPTGENDGDVNLGEPPKPEEGADHLTEKGEGEHDTGRTERKSTEPGGLGGTSREERTAAGRRDGQDDLVHGERETVLRTGENRDVGQVRDSDTDSVRSGNAGVAEDVQRQRGTSERGQRTSAARGDERGGSDTAGGSAGHEVGRGESVGQSAEPGERVKASDTQPKTPARERYYATTQTRKEVNETFTRPKERYEQNKDAIDAVMRLTDNGRITDMSLVHPTKNDLDTISKFSGWGGLSSYVRDMHNTNDEWLTTNFSEEEITALINSTETAYFTPPEVVEFMWKAVARMGIPQRGRVLEPSMGVGNFIMQLPKEYRDSMHVTGIELDPTTGKMAQILFPNSPKTNIRVMGYEQNRSGDNSFDLVIGNVPFSGGKFVSGEKRFDRMKAQLHDFFFLKAAKQVRPGGVVAFITTAGTMDKINTNVRRALAADCDLVAAYRLPAGVFPGTEVVTDIIFLQKRGERLENVGGVGWIHSGEYDSELDVNVNEYFRDNPDHVLGRIGRVHDWRSGSFKMTVRSDGNSRADVLEQVQKDLQAALRKIPKDIVTDEKTQERNTVESQNISAKVGAIFVQNGKFYRQEGAEAVEVSREELGITKDTVAKEAELVLALTKKYRDLLAADMNDAPNADALRAEVKKDYEALRKGKRKLTSAKGYKAILKAGDGSVSILTSLEDSNGKPRDILTKRVIRPNAKPVNPTIPEAVIISGALSGDVNVGEIAGLTGKSEADVRAELVKENLAFETPSGNWQTREKYLNGNIAEKLDEARNALEYGNQAMKHNIAELEKVLPEPIPMNSVVVGFGAAWIRPEVYRDFVIDELYGSDINQYRRDSVISSNTIQVSLAGEACSIHVDIKKLPRGHSANTAKWLVEGNSSSSDINFNRVLSAAIGNKELSMQMKDEDGNISIDKEKTQMANAMVQRLQNDWQEYVRTGKHRDELAASYNYRFNSFHTPTFDGTHMTFPGMRKEMDGRPFSLREHQRNAVYKGLVQGRGVFAHEVGTGKTYVMGALAMESKRLGLARKSLILAKGANYQAVAEDIQNEYPGAKVLLIDEKDSGAGGQLADAMMGDWDIIVAPHSQTGLFLLSDTEYAKAEERIRENITKHLEAISDNMKIPNDVWRMVRGEISPGDKEAKDALKKMRGESVLEAKELARSLSRQLTLLEKYKKAIDEAEHLPFEQLGIDQILVDEAHEFKKPGIITQSSVKGVETGVSGMGLKLSILADYIQNTYGRGVHLFTGTPITNTATELYQMMRYVMRPEMEAAGVGSFDSWFATYAIAESTLAKKPTGEYEDEVRFTGFKNLPELQRMYRMFFDFVQTKEMPEFTPRQVDGYKLTDDNVPDDVREKLENGRTENATDVPYHRIVNVRVEMSPEMVEYAKDLEHKAKQYAAASGKVKKELRDIGFEGVPAAALIRLNQLGLDPRLVGGQDYAGSKIQQCADTIFKEYQLGDNVSQAVFMQEGVSDEREIVKRDEQGFVVRDNENNPVKEKVPGWNVAQALKDELVNRGIPKDEIVILSSNAKVMKELRQRYKEKYNLPKQPEDDDLKTIIAKEVSDCKVRVVIGTRAMLGTGINMQHNLKAIHQLDAPWMPGELKQAQGRAVRQNNQWNTATEYRYVTDLDAVRWTRLAIKESFINAIISQESKSRSLEMDESMGSTIGGAEGDIYLTLSVSSQDNRLMEQKRLEKKVSKLEAAQRGFYRAKEALEAEAKKAAENLPQLQQLLSSAESLQEKLTDDPLVLEGAKEDEKELTTVQRLNSLVAANRDKDVPLGTYRGLQIIGKRVWSSKEIYLTDGNTRVHVNTLDGSVSASALRAAVNTHLGKEVERLKERIDGYKRAQETWKVEKSAVFPEEEALEKARTRRDAIIEDIKRNPEKPPVWLMQEVPPNSTVTANGEKTIIRSYFVGKNANGDKVHYLIGDEGDLHHISTIRSNETGLNPYEPYLKDEPEDITPVIPKDEETTEDADEAKYSVAENEEQTKERGETETDETADEDTDAEDKAEQGEITDELRQEALDASKKELQAASEAWSKQVDEFMQAKKYPRSSYYVMEGPVVFDLLGIPRLPIHIQAQAMEKILKAKHKNENLLEFMRCLPEEIASPAAIVKNIQNNKEEPITDGALVFTSYLAKGNPVNVAFQFAKIGNEYVVSDAGEVQELVPSPNNAHRVKTAFGRTNTERLTKAIESGGVLYWNTQKGATLLSWASGNLRHGQERSVTPYLSTSVADDSAKVNTTDSTEKGADTTGESLSAKIPADVPTEKDLERLIVESYAKDNEVRYQPKQNMTETYTYTQADVQKAFQGQQVAETGSGYTVRLKNGQSVTITKQGTFRNARGQLVRGMYKDGEITLTDLANETTLAHEVLHFAWENLYTDKEVAALEKAARAVLKTKGNTSPTGLELEEQAARMYEDWQANRRYAKTPIGKLFRLLKDFVTRVRNLVQTTGEGVFLQTARGDVFSRESASRGNGTERYSVEETTRADTSRIRQAMDWLGRKAGTRTAKNVDFDDRLGDTPSWGMLMFAPPDHLGKQNQTIRVFTDMGKKTMRELERTRNDVDEDMEYIHSQLDGRNTMGQLLGENKKEVERYKEIYNNILLEGEAERKTFTRDELKGEGVPENVINAYERTRDLYERMYTMADDTQRNATYYDRVLGQNALDRLQANKFADVLKVEPLANGQFQVSWKQAHTDTISDVSRTVAAVKAMRDDKNIDITYIAKDDKQVKNLDELADTDTVKVTYRVAAPHIGNVAGYVHHLFEDWMVYKKTYDESDNATYEPVASFAGRMEAVREVNKLADDDKSVEYVIRPKMFVMPTGSGMLVGAAAYNRMIRVLADKMEISQGEARDMMRGVVDKRKHHRFLGAAQHRKGAEGYTTDMLRALRGYTTQVTRYAALEGFKYNANKQFERIFGKSVEEAGNGTTLERWIKKYIADVNGEPTWLEKEANHLLRGLCGVLGTERPAVKLANTEMTIAALCKLGLGSVSSAAINLTQLMNTYAILGVEPILKAHWSKGKFTEAEHKFLRDAGVDTEIGFSSGAGYDSNRHAHFLVKAGLYPFTWTEQKIRQISALAAREVAKKKGMNYRQAVSFAQEVNDKANFDYGINNTAQFIRAGGPVTQMFFQFQKYPVNQLALIADVLKNGTPKQRARLIVLLVVSGVSGIPFWNALAGPMLAALVAWVDGDEDKGDDWELYLKKKAWLAAQGDPLLESMVKTAFHGLPGLAGLDVGRRIGVGDWGGDWETNTAKVASKAAAGVMGESIVDAMRQLRYGNTVEAVRSISPALGNIAQAIVQERHTTRGRLAVKYDDAYTRVLKAFGFRPLKEAIETDKARMIAQERATKRDRDNETIDAYIRAYEAGDREEMAELGRELRKRGISKKRVDNERKRKKRTQLERAIDGANKKERRALGRKYSWE